MVMNDDEIDIKLASPNNMFNRLRKGGELEKEIPSLIQVEDIQKGTRGEGSEELDPLIRELIGSTPGTTREVAEGFDVSQYTVSNLQRGLLGSSLDTTLRDNVQKTREDKSGKAHDLALDAMLGALTHLTVAMSGVDNPKDLSKIASDMSKITANLKEKDTNLTNNIKVVVFAPSIKEERRYEVLDVG